MQNPTSAPVMFHHFFSGEHPRGQGAINAKQLDFLIRSLGRDRILSAGEWLQAAQAGTLKPNQICLTFDDSLRCQFDVALPVLRSFGITGFWFVYTCYLSDRALPRLEVYRYFRTVQFPDIEDYYVTFFSAAIELYGTEVRDWLDRFDRSKFPMYPSHYSLNDCRFRQIRDALLGSERYFKIMDALLEAHGFDPEKTTQMVMMDAANLRELQRDGHVIGLHSHTHPTQLSLLSPEEQESEYRNNYEELTRILGEKPISMSHPCNSYDAGTLRILGDLGIKIGFRADTQMQNGDALQFPRIDHMLLLKEFS